jgi:hypothetical protein
MEVIGRRLSIHEFRDYVSSFDFGPQKPDKLVVHHTWRPTKEGWDGERTIQGLKNYYEGKGWPAGPHLFVAEDGIWLFSSMRHDGIHAGTLNTLSVGIEVVGDYDNQVWDGQTKYHALGVIKVLSDHLSIPRDHIFFHRDASSKSCPGNAITKEWIFAELDTYRILPQIPTITPTMEAISSVSAPLPEPADEIMIPLWAAESVTWVQQHNLFEIREEQDVRDAVKFHRFYKLIQNS